MNSHPDHSESERSERTDLAYAAAYAGFVGSAVVAIFFLLRDAWLGTPLLTPSIFGSALFEGRVPTGGAPVDLERVALVSLVHVALFTCVGAVFAYLIHVLESLRSHPLMLSIGLFATLSVGIVSLDVLVAPGLISAIGSVSVTLANASTAVAMTGFYRTAFTEETTLVAARG